MGGGWETKIGTSRAAAERLGGRERRIEDGSDWVPGWQREARRGRRLGGVIVTLRFVRLFMTSKSLA